MVYEPTESLIILELPSQFRCPAGKVTVSEGALTISGGRRLNFHAGRSNCELGRGLWTQVEDHPRPKVDDFVFPLIAILIQATDGDSCVAYAF